MAAWPVAALITAIVWGAGLITAGLNLKRTHLLIVFLANIAVLYLAGGLVSTIYIMSLCGLAMMIMSYMAWRGGNYYELQKAGVAIAVVGLSLFLGISYFETQDGWKQELQSELNTYLDQSMQSYEESGLAGLYAEQGITKEEFLKSAKEVSRAIIQHLYAIFYLQVIVTVFFALLLAVFISRKRADERLKKKPYRQEMMAWQLVWVVIAGLALCLWGSRQGNGLFYVGSNILVVLVPITVYYGLAAVIYKIGQMRETPRRWFTVITVVLSTLFLPSALIFFSIFGMFDALLDYRKLRIVKGD